LEIQLGRSRRARTLALAGPGLLGFTARRKKLEAT